jgi:uncharacterized membrane protein YraQ (UPF0718 family)
MGVLHGILAVALSAAPWLLLGLFVSGLIKALLPEAVLKRWVGGEGLAGISRAAVIGAPLPLCSCGAIPTALTLHRAGAGRGPTTAFLVGTPGIGVDSLALSYALLGPFMMLARAIGAVFTAIVTGVLVAAGGRDMKREQADAASCGSSCGSSCKTDSAHGHEHGGAHAQGLGVRLRAGMNYAFDDLLEDIGPWLLGGLLIAGALITFLPPQALASHGSGLPVMLLMAVIGVPLYICAAAATPVAAGMLLAGVSPGTVLVFLLAGPITSAATLGLLRREFGNAGLACYLAGIITSAICAGLVVDALVGMAGIDVVAQAGAASELLPTWFEASALALLLWFGTRPVRRLALNRLSRPLPR